MMRLASLRFLLAMALLTLLAARWALAEESAIHVSPEGNDAWSGTLPDPNPRKSDGPVATLEKARELVRAVKARQGDKAGPIHVYLRGGTYFLRQPLTLDPEDSGTPQAPVAWSCYQHERPVLSGGQLLTGWSKTKINGREAWMAKLTASDPRGALRELWFNGKRLTRARWPKTRTLSVVGLSDHEKHDKWNYGSTEFRYAANDLKAWPGLSDGEAIVANRWVESHLPLESIDEKGHVVHFTKRSVFLLEPGDRYWVENVRNFLTEPGEFYFNAHEQAIYLIPPAGRDPNQGQIIAPRLAQVLRLQGDPAAGKFVQLVTFRGIAFTHTEWCLDRATSGFSQAAIGMPGAVWAVGARSCTFEACEVSHIGNYGIELSRGCQKNRIVDCTFTDLGAGGVKIGETAIRDAEKDQTFGNEISDCTIADGGNLFPSCVALWVGQSHDNTIAHNDIHGFWYTGISVGWTWGYGKAAAQRNVVEHNHVHHIGVKSDGQPPILSDMACIYTLGDQEGSVIRFNRFHDIAGLKYGGWGIYFDEGTTHILAENNLVYRTTHGGFHQHYGKENTVRNNIFAYARDAQLQRTRVEGHRSFTFERNIVLWDSGVLLSGNWNEIKAAFDRNTYWRVSGGAIRFGNRTWDQWRKAGMDEHSQIADPRFTNPAAGEFTFPAESESSLAGFKQFDLSDAGPRAVAGK